jgi:hypothetical protein
MFTPLAARCLLLDNYGFLKQQTGAFVKWAHPKACNPLNRAIARFSRMFAEAYAIAETSWTGEVPCVCGDVQQVGTSRREWFPFH